MLAESPEILDGIMVRRCGLSHQLEDEDVVQIVKKKARPALTCCRCSPEVPFDRHAL